MVRQHRVDPDVDRLWQEFHDHVNVPADRLRQWLLSRGSGAEAFGADPDLGLPQPGRRILAVLGKRKVDLTAADVRVMREAVDRVRQLLDERPTGGGPEADRWRYALLDLGHDVLRPA
jgi:hypothetical protein